MDEGDSLTCEECNKLWKTYEDAVFEHVRLNNRHKFANASGDPDATARIAKELELATARRTASREALLLHERESGHGFRAE